MNISAPATLLMIGVQREYATPGRPFFMDSIGSSLENASLLLDLARASHWRVIHVRHEHDGPVFTKGGAYTDFIEGFDPLPGERVIVKSQISPFSEPDFKTAITAAGPQPVYVAGFCSTMCCLATMVGAPLLGHRFNFVHDASWARAPRIDITEKETHWHATAMIALHGDVVATEEVVGLALEGLAA